MALLKIISAFILIFVLSGCGDRKDERVSKGHRDAIKIQCEDASNIKACGLEVRENFIEDGNEYADFSELNDDQIDVVKFVKFLKCGEKEVECPNDFYKLEEDAQDILIKSAFSIDQYKKI